MVSLNPSDENKLNGGAPVAPILKKGLIEISLKSLQNRFRLFRSATKRCRLFRSPATLKGLGTTPLGAASRLKRQHRS
jgi:hypothetical protein